MKKFLFAAALLSMAVACDDQGGKDAYSNLTPDENKQKLEDVALDALSRINARNHETFCAVLDDFIRCTSESILDFPQDVDNASSSSLQASADVLVPVMDLMRQVATKGNISGLTSLSDPANVVFRATDYYGIWTYVEGEQYWSFAESNEKLEFSFPSEGKTASATAVASGSNVEVEVQGETYVIPSEVNVAVKLGNEVIAEGKVTVSYTGKGGNASISVSVSVADVKAYSNVVLSSQSGEANAVLEIGGEEIVRVYANCSGNGMTDIDGIIEGAENSVIPVNGANAEVLIMNEVKVSARCSDVNGFASRVNAIDDQYYEDSWVRPPYWYEKKEYQEAISDNFNSYFTITYGYAPVFATIASGLMKPMSRESTSWDQVTYTSWYSDVIIRFNNDGSEFSLGSYFDETGFGSLIDEVNRLAEIYEKYMDYCFGE